MREDNNSSSSNSELASSDSLIQHLYARKYGKRPAIVALLSLGVLGVVLIAVLVFAVISASSGSPNTPAAIRSRELDPVPSVVEAAASPYVYAGTSVVSEPMPTSQAVNSPQHPRPTARPTCGSWDIVPIADLAGQPGVLAAVAVAGPDDVWAVGWTSRHANRGSDWRLGAPANAQGLIVHWNGSVWRMVPAPLPEGTILNSIAAVASDDIWAVGTILDDSNSTPDANASAGFSTSALILRWDGRTWSQVSIPQHEPVPYQLLSVSAASTDDVWAVGLLHENYASRSIMLHWDGRDWRNVPLPGPIYVTPTPNSLPIATFVSYYRLTAVAAVSRNEAWAVGTASDPLNSWYSYVAILRWDGVAWQYSSAHGHSGNLRPGNLLGVGAYLGESSYGDGPGEVWAVGGVGSQRPPGGVPPPSTSGVIIRETAGTDKWQWMEAPCSTPEPCGDEPDGGFTIDDLSSVAAIASDNVWAVGRRYHSPSFGEPGSTTRALVEHWDGAVWTVVPVDALANASKVGSTEKDSSLMSVAAMPTGDGGGKSVLWAVGSLGGQRDVKPLILHYVSAPCIPSTPATTP